MTKTNRRSAIFPMAALLLALTFAPAPRARAQWSTGYYSGGDAAAMPPSEIPFQALTHLVHDHVAPNSDGSLDYQSLGISEKASRTVVAAAHKAKVKVLLCVANTWPRTSSFSGATDAAHLDTFIKNLVTVMQKRGYDGIDIDWEPLTDADLPQFRLLARGLRKAMDAISPRPLLTVALWHQEKAAAALQDCFDQINIMTYDMTYDMTGGAGRTWHNAALHSPDGSVFSVDSRAGGFAAAGVAPRKIGIGIPFYGYVYTGATVPLQTSPKGSGFAPMNYNAIMAKLYRPGFEKWDPAAQVPYLSIDDGKTSGKFVTYENAASVAAKVNYVRAKKYGGWIIWNLALDYFPDKPAMALKHPLAEAVRAAMQGN